MNETTPDIRERLEELRLVLRSESMSYGELAELQGLAPHIDRGDVELLEAAGVPEFPDEEPHKGHYSLFGTYWCDTCNSPYCELA